MGLHSLPLWLFLASLLLDGWTAAAQPALGQDYMESESFMVNGVQAFSGGGDDWTPFTQPGPCLNISRLSNIPLDMSPGATGCNALIGQCRINLIITAPLDCSAVPKPFPVNIHFNGYQVAARYYNSIANQLASWGNVVIMYDRPGRTTPPNEVETAFVGQILTRAAAVNSTRGHPLYGSMDLRNLGVTGHSMGGSLASVAAAQRADLVKSVVLLDPVDYTQLSTRVARSFLKSYGKEMAILTVGVHCIDRNGCMPPLDHRPTTAELKTYTNCTNIDLFCCDWDYCATGLEPKTLANLTQPTAGAEGYWQVAAKGSLQVKLKQAGHMSFMNWNPATDSGFEFVNCPQIVSYDKVLPDALTVIAGWAAYKLQGTPLDSLLEWVSSPANSYRMSLALKS